MEFDSADRMHECSDRKTAGSVIGKLIAQHKVIKEHKQITTARLHEIGINRGGMIEGSSVGVLFNVFSSPWDDKN